MHQTKKILLIQNLTLNESMRVMTWKMVNTAPQMLSNDGPAPLGATYLQSYPLGQNVRACSSAPFSRIAHALSFKMNGDELFADGETESADACDPSRKERHRKCV